MNTFECDFRIAGKLYTVYVDSSHDEWKKIAINGQEIANEKYTLAFNSRAYIIYYPVEVDGNELIISIDDNPLRHIYNIYLNGVSILDKTRVDEQYVTACSIVNKGFATFIKKSWHKILKDNLFGIIGTAITLSALCNLTLNEFGLRILLAFMIMQFALPIFVAGEWFHNRNIVKNYKSCFRPKTFLN